MRALIIFSFLALSSCAQTETNLRPEAGGIHATGAPLQLRSAVLDRGPRPHVWLDGVNKFRFRLENPDTEWRRGICVLTARVVGGGLLTITLDNLVVGPNSFVPVEGTLDTALPIIEGSDNIAVTWGAVSKDHANWVQGQTIAPCIVVTPAPPTVVKSVKPILFELSQTRSENSTKWTLVMDNVTKDAWIVTYLVVTTLDGKTIDTEEKTLRVEGFKKSEPISKTIATQNGEVQVTAETTSLVKVQ